jgi:hypothetical protein
MAIVETKTNLDNRNMIVLSRCPRLELRTATVEAIEQAVEGRVTIRSDDILFDKQRMKKLAELTELYPKDGLTRLFEQLWHSLARQQPKKTGTEMRHEKRWRPQLQTIPEEI